MLKGTVTVCCGNFFTFQLREIKTLNSQVAVNVKQQETMIRFHSSDLIIKRTDYQTCILLLDRLVTPSILRPYCWLLKHFKENKETTNHAIIKMLHRVAVDLKTPAMLFQLSLFCTFQKILCDPAANQYKVSHVILVSLQTIHSRHALLWKFVDHVMRTMISSGFH